MFPLKNRSQLCCAGVVNGFFKVSMLPRQHTVDGGDLVHMFQRKLWHGETPHSDVPCCRLNFIVLQLQCSYLVKVIRRKIHRERLNLSGCGMFAPFGIDLVSILQVLIGKKLADSVPKAHLQQLFD